MIRTREGSCRRWRRDALELLFEPPPPWPWVINCTHCRRGGGVHKSSTAKKEELKSFESLQPASRSCKEVDDYVGANPDPLIPINQKIHRSCRFWRWLCGNSCLNLSWICCFRGCSSSRKTSNNCDICSSKSMSCSCRHCFGSNPCCRRPQCCCQCGCGCSCNCFGKKTGCKQCCCKIPAPSCPDCSCSKCFSCSSCFKCPKSCLCFNCKDLCCCNPCSLFF